MYKIFIDGEVGTTGLQVKQRLEAHPKITVISIDYDKRKSTEEKQALMSKADITVLCLPDEAAIESAKLANEVDARVIDASTAHRVNDDWIYGLPEMTATQKSLIHHAKRVSNPGCYSTGAILLMRPIVEAGLNIPFNLHAVTGYTGGGSQMIANYEQDKRHDDKAYSLYGLGFDHKHIPEIMKYSGLNSRPTFFPAVVNIDQGMMVQLAIHEQMIESELHTKFVQSHHNFGAAMHYHINEYYRNHETVCVHPLNEFDKQTAPFLQVTGNRGSVNTDIYIGYNEVYKQATLIARFDNLGKGASGAAVQNINIMLGLDEFLGVYLTD